MTFKIIGCLILLFSGGYVSVALSRFEKKRLQVLDGYLALLYYMKGQIECYALPVRDILARADPSLVSDCLGLPRTADASSLIPALLLSEAPFSRLVEESRLYLVPEAERLLLTFSGELGHTFRADQVLRCDHYMTVLGEERRHLAEALPTRLRVLTTLAVSVAIGASILLW